MTTERSSAEPHAPPGANSGPATTTAPTSVGSSIPAALANDEAVSSSPAPAAPALASEPTVESYNTSRHMSEQQQQLPLRQLNPGGRGIGINTGGSSLGSRRGSRSGIYGGSGSDSTAQRRHSFGDSLTPRSSYPFSQLAARDLLLEPLDEEPSRDPRDTSAPTPSTVTGGSTFGTAGDAGYEEEGVAVEYDEQDAGAPGRGETALSSLALAPSQSQASQVPAVVDFDGLSWPSTGTRRRLDASEEERTARKEKLAGAVRTILECVGEDVQREGLLKTPHRYAEALMFFTNGYEQNLRDIVNGAIFNEDHNEMVIVRDIEVMSMCEHHLVPFMGRMYIGYIPAGRVLGLSKFARIAEMFARRLQVQERLTKQVAAAINEVLRPQGVAVVIESAHLCMVMRGVQQTQSTTTTSCMLGAFERRDRTRQEFLSLALRR